MCIGPCLKLLVQKAPTTFNVSSKQCIFHQCTGRFGSYVDKHCINAKLQAALLIIGYGHFEPSRV